MNRFLVNDGGATATRAARAQAASRDASWDLVVIGGGATGLGVAVQAAAQGYQTLLLEAADFAAGTSSRSTKLLHGGVRYLAQGHLGLVRDALHERETVIRNAPSLAHPLSFVLPTYRWRDGWMYRLGLRAYEWLAGSSSLGPTRWLNAELAKRHSPELESTGLCGLVTYWDGQFDDAGLALSLARTAERLGAVVLNHSPVQSVETRQGHGHEVRWRDAQGGAEHVAQARCVVNAAGGWLDRLRSPHLPPSITLSRGTHVVVDRAFWPHEHGMIIPRTQDGRVLFVLPWQGHALLGTTDVPCDTVTMHPRADPQEVSFILQEADRYLVRSPQWSDITSMWSGLRSLMKPDGMSHTPTRNIGREHAIWKDPDGMVCVAGGKWTTYRLMAEQTVAFCRDAGLLAAETALISTRHLALDCPQPAMWDHLQGAGRVLAPGVTEAFVRWCVRVAQACTVEDVLARRSRLLLVDARGARQVAPEVADIMHLEGVEDPGLDRFMALTSEYLPDPGWLNGMT